MNGRRTFMKKFYVIEIITFMKLLHLDLICYEIEFEMSVFDIS